MTKLYKFVMTKVLSDAVKPLLAFIVFIAFHRFSFYILLSHLKMFLNWERAAKCPHLPLMQLIVPKETTRKLVWIQNEGFPESLSSWSLALLFEEAFCHKKILRGLAYEADWKKKCFCNQHNDGSVTFHFTKKTR